MIILKQLGFYNYLNSKNTKIERDILDSVVTTQKFIKEIHKYLQEEIRMAQLWLLIKIII